jgi:hypothetical protein
MKASDEIAALDEDSKRLRLYMAVLSAVAEGRQTLSPDAAGRIRDEITRLTTELEAANDRAAQMHRRAQAAEGRADALQEQLDAAGYRPTQQDMRYWRRAKALKAIREDWGKAELEAVKAERDRAMQACEQMAVRLGERRMCLNCGKTRPASEPKDDLPECTSPEFPGLAACTWDATPEEAWQVWRDRAYEARGERAALAEALQVYAASCDANGDGKCPYDGNLCCKRARDALARLAP